MDVVCGIMMRETMSLVWQVFGDTKAFADLYQAIEHTEGLTNAAPSSKVELHGRFALLHRRPNDRLPVGPHHARYELS
jgi:hypothetical protein